MTADAASAPAPIWLRPYLPAFGEVLRVIDLAGGFVLLPVVSSGPDLTRDFARWLTEEGHPAFVIAPEDEASWEQLAATLLAARPKPEGVVMVLGPREPPAGLATGLRLVNQQRDTIVRHLGCPLLWCGPEAFQDFTMERAPDFWSIRALEQRLEAAAAEEDAAPERAAPRGVEGLRQDLDAARTQGDAVSAARITVRLADELLSRGQFAEAADAAREAREHLPPKERELGAELLLREAESARHRRNEGEISDAVKALRTAAPDIGKHLNGRIQLLLGRLLENGGDRDDAEACYREALTLASDSDDPTLEALSQMRLGALRSRAEQSDGGSSNHAIDSLLRAGALAGQLGDRALEAEVTALHAQAMGRLHDEREAKSLLARARELRNAARGAPTCLLGGELEEAIAAAELDLDGSDPPASSIWLAEESAATAAARLRILEARTRLNTALAAHESASARASSTRRAINRFLRGCALALVSTLTLDIILSLKTGFLSANVLSASLIAITSLVVAITFWRDSKDLHDVEREFEKVKIQLGEIEAMVSKLEIEQGQRNKRSPRATDEQPRERFDVAHPSQPPASSS